MVGSIINMKYGRDDELEADALGIRFSAEAGYDPRAMLGVMEVLAKASQGARQPEMLSTHPNPENRVERIKQEIAKQFPNGVPQGLVR
jgi:beta-barrel assembly-enhancing protease